MDFYSCGEELECDPEIERLAQKATLIYTSSQSTSVYDSDQFSRGRIFLGGEHAAQDMEFFREQGIKAVLTVAEQLLVSYSPDKGISHLIVDAIDSTDYDIKSDFPQCFSFLDEHLPNTNILVHCKQGVSRSPTIVIAYIMKTESRIFSEALREVRNKRPQICPNGGFFFHLSKFADELKANKQKLKK